MKCPEEICEHAGPRTWDDTWGMHWDLAKDIQPQIYAPWDSSANWEATQLYARFSWAAESYFMSTDPQATDRQHDRGSKIEFAAEEVASGMMLPTSMPLLGALSGSSWAAKSGSSKAS